MQGRWGAFRDEELAYLSTALRARLAQVKDTKEDAATGNNMLIRLEQALTERTEKKTNVEKVEKDKG